MQASPVCRVDSKFQQKYVKPNIKYEFGCAKTEMTNLQANIMLHALGI